MTSLSRYVKYFPKDDGHLEASIEGPRLVVYSSEDHDLATTPFLDITPTTCNDVKMRTRWHYFDAHGPVVYGESNLRLPDCQSFVFDCHFRTLTVNENQFTFPHPGLAKNFDRLLNLVIGPNDLSALEHGSLLGEQGKLTPADIVELNARIKALLEEQFGAPIW